MIEPQHLELLRCPLDPQRQARLILEDTRVLCEKCRLHFREREGFLSVLVSEATLPEGCTKLEQLPCQTRR